MKCHECKEQAEDGYTRCSKHRAKNKQSAQEFRDTQPELARQRGDTNNKKRRLAKSNIGQCWECDELARADFALCESCAARSAARHKSWRTIKLDNGMCGRCGQIQCIEGLRSCADCAREARMFSEERRKVNPGYGAAWNKANREKKALYSAHRRALKNAAAGTSTVEQLQSRIDFYGGCCYICKLLGKLTPYEAIDHVIPLAKGGNNWPSNLRPICCKHNSSKQASSLNVFLRRIA